MANLLLDFFGTTKLRDAWGKFKFNFNSINEELIAHILETTPGYKIVNGGYNVLPEDTFIYAASPLEYSFSINLYELTPETIGKKVTVYNGSSVAVLSIGNTFDVNGEAKTAVYYPPGSSVTYENTGGEYWYLVSSNMSDDIIEGYENKYFTDERVRDALLSGLSLANSTPVGAGDTALAAIGKLQGQITAHSQLVADYTVVNPTPISMLASQVTNDGAGKILITFATPHGYQNTQVLELSGAIPTGIIKINHTSFPMLSDKAYVYVMNMTAYTIQIAAAIGGPAISYVDGGTNGWTLVRPVHGSVTLSSLPFSDVGTEWNINIVGTLAMASSGDSHQFRLNGITTSPSYSSSQLGSGTGSYYMGGPPTARRFYKCNININLKRISATKLSVIAFQGGMSNDISVPNAIAVTPVIYVGEVDNASFSSLNSFTYITTVSAFISGTKITIKRVN